MTAVHGASKDAIRQQLATQWSATEAAIAQLTSPHHRAILENYRRHSMLEICGRFDEILAPDMTVEHPVYYINVPEGRRVYDGRDAVRNMFYGGLAKAGGTFLLKEHEHVAVADWGFSQEQLTHYHLSAEAAVARGYEVDDMNAVFVEDRWTSMQWHYSPDARLIGEHVYRAPVSEFRKVDASNFLTVEEAREVLDPIIARGNFRQD